MIDAILRMNIADSPFVGIVYTLGLGAFLFLALRRPSTRWIVTAVAALLAGSLCAFLVLWFVTATDAFGVGLGTGTVIWVYLAFSAICLAIANLWRSRATRKVVASLSIVLFLLVGTVGINADFGLDRTVADLVGVSAQKPLKLPKAAAPTAAPTPLAVGALWAIWKPPKDLPTAGTTGTVVIPNTASHFRSRPAGLYLPPAAPESTPLPRHREIRKGRDLPHRRRRELGPRQPPRASGCRALDHRRLLERRRARAFARHQVPADLGQRARHFG